MVATSLGDSYINAYSGREVSSDRLILRTKKKMVDILVVRSLLMDCAYGHYSSRSLDNSRING